VVFRDNVQATLNVLDAAARHGSRRVILASSCMWALGLEEETAPGWVGPRITAAAQPRPRTKYGLSKAWGELAGRMFVDVGRLPSVVVVRIGTFSAEKPTDERQRRLWVRPADARTLFRRCVEAEFEGFHVVYALSREAAEWFDFSSARELLGWKPEEFR
jgi:uronate dehydrogenase